MIEKILALIPARGGSKGIPRKNIMMIGGRPLIAHSILQAQASRYISRVVVSTDDDEIAEISRAWGAEVPFQRPAEFAQDHSPDLDVFRHTLEWFDNHEGYVPDLVVHLRPPGPARRVELIDAAIRSLLADPEADALRSVSVALQTPYKMWQIDDEGLLSPVVRIAGVSDAQSLPRQQLPVVYWQNGYVDVIRPRAILEKNSMWGSRAIPFIVDEPPLEIDYPENIPQVEAALLRLNDEEAARALPVRHPV